MRVSLSSGSQMSAAGERGGALGCLVKQAGRWAEGRGRVGRRTGSGPREKEGERGAGPRPRGREGEFLFLYFYIFLSFISKPFSKIFKKSL